MPQTAVSHRVMTVLPKPKSLSNSHKDVSAEIILDPNSSKAAYRAYPDLPTLLHLVTLSLMRSRMEFVKRKLKWSGLLTWICAGPSSVKPAAQIVRYINLSFLSVTFLFTYITYIYITLRYSILLTSKLKKHQVGDGLVHQDFLTIFRYL